MQNIQFESVSSIIEVAKEMTANDFILEFGQAVEYHDIDNLFNLNEGVTNISLPALNNGEEVEVFILFVDGQFADYSF